MSYKRGDIVVRIKNGEGMKGKIIEKTSDDGETYVVEVLKTIPGHSPVGAYPYWTANNFVLDTPASPPTPDWKI